MVKKLTPKEAASKLNAYLLEQEAVKEYQQYEAVLKKHPELLTMEEELKTMQKEMIVAKAKEQDIDIARYQKLKKQFEEHPLVVNYMYLKEEVNTLLQETASLINEGLNE